MTNTFWTLIEDGYYRIKDGVLLYAPVCRINSSVLSHEQSIVQIISPEKLELINIEFGSKFLISDFSHFG